MSDQIYDTLGAIRESLGRIEQKADSTLAWMTKHSEAQVADLAKITSDVSDLKLSQARQKGFMSALGVVGTLAGSGIGYLIERITLGKH